MPISIIVHGGAKDIPPEEHEAHCEGCRKAAEAGWAVLERGGTSMEAVEAAIRVLEDDTTFNAGHGSELNEDGDVQMDAGVMDGSTLKSGAVAFIEGVRHPVTVARQVYESEEVLLAGDGARRFAQECVEAELCDPKELITEKQLKKWEKKESSGANNTVGCVALDDKGVIAAGASTGGTGGNPRGRVGDTPLVGCGTYADNLAGGCSMTGDGESIARIVAAKMAVDMLADAIPPDAVAKRVLQKLEQRTGGDGGCILMTPGGRVGWGHNSGNIAVAYRTPDTPEPRAFVHKCEEG